MIAIPVRPVISLTTSVSFHVHLLEGLLNVLHVMRGVTHQHRALREVAAQDADLIVGSERSRERPRVWSCWIHCRQSHRSCGRRHSSSGAGSRGSRRRLARRAVRTAESIDAGRFLATVLTPHTRSHVVSACKSAVKAPNDRTSWPSGPRPSGTGKSCRLAPTSTPAATVRSSRGSVA